MIVKVNMTKILEQYIDQEIFESLTGYKVIEFVEKDGNGHDIYNCERPLTKSELNKELQALKKRVTDLEKNLNMEET